MEHSTHSTFQGISFAEAKRIAEYEFAGSIIKIDKNIQDRNYEIHLIDKIEKKAIEKFKSYWKKKFTVKVYSLKYEM